MSTLKVIVTDNNGARELLGQELDDFLAQQAKDKAEADSFKAEAQAKATQKAALLERLGITEDEAKLLLG